MKPLIYKLVVSVTIGLLVQLYALSPACAEVRSSGAKTIQAAFLVKFSSYVKWPEGVFSRPDSSIIIGILGRDPFGSIVDKIARSHIANGRHVEIRRCNDIASLGKSHIVFIPSREMVRLNEIRTALSDRPILFVGDSPDFLKNSGMINFLTVKNKIRFDISKKNLEKAGLEISSKLFKVAHAVQ